MRILRPQEIPTYVADGLFDLGITGRDWVEETASDVVSLGELHYSKASSEPGPHRRRRAAGLALRQGRGPAAGRARWRASTRELTRRFFAERGIDADVRMSYGATEAKVPDIVDCIVDLTETGRALRAAGLKIIGEILQSLDRADRQPRPPTRIPTKRHAMVQLKTLLDGVLEARGKVLVKLNVRRRRPRRRHRPAAVDEGARRSRSCSARAATPSRRWCEKSEINTLIPALKDAGASDIIELPLAKIVH